MLDELGVQISIVQVRTDATAAKGIASRRGAGRVRHIEVADLWVQDQVQQGRIEIVKVRSEDNMADAMTKFVPAQGILSMLQKAAIQFHSGRHKEAPMLDGPRATDRL